MGNDKGEFKTAVERPKGFESAMEDVFLNGEVLQVQSLAEIRQWPHLDLSS